MVNTRNPTASRRLILDAAAQAFAAHGPAGARIDAIAAEAGVNKRMLYHYFGDKDALFAAVLDDRLENRADLPPARAVFADGLPMDVLDLRLMVWAAVAGVGPGSASAAAWQRLIQDLTVEQQAGQWRDDVDARVLAVVVLALSALPQLLPQLAVVLTGTADASWPQLRKLLGPAEARAKSVLHPGRPRVRMLPEVRGR